MTPEKPIEKPISSREFKSKDEARTYLELEVAKINEVAKVKFESGDKGDMSVEEWEELKASFPITYEMFVNVLGAVYIISENLKDPDFFAQVREIEDSAVNTVVKEEGKRWRREIFSSALFAYIGMKLGEKFSVTGSDVANNLITFLGAVKGADWGKKMGNLFADIKNESTRMHLESIGGPAKIVNDVIHEYQMFFWELSGFMGDAMVHMPTINKAVLAYMKDFSDDDKVKVLHGVYGADENVQREYLS